MALSLGIMAWNEESSIVRTLESLFGQSVFGRLADRGECCEIVCLANGCTDRTAAVTGWLFARMEREHPDRRGFVCRVADMPAPGRNQAWNRFVHEFSDPDARFLCLMDADIVFLHRDTLHNLTASLDRNAHASVATGGQIKSIVFKARRSLRERISLATSDMTGTIAGRFSGQLYCLRAGVARRIRLPRDLGATDDGFLKTIICTDFLTSKSDPTRIARAVDAAHVYEPYLSVRELLKNQKRQMIGQTSVHVLIEYLKTLPEPDRANLAGTLARLDREDPDWLRKKIDRHVARTRFPWQLFPGILAFRWRRLGSLKGAGRLTHFPAAAAGFVVTLAACWQARRHLRRGGRTSYWPKAVRDSGRPLERTPA